MHASKTKIILFHLSYINFLQLFHEIASLILLCINFAEKLSLFAYEGYKIH